ncbi:hypothetical protein V2J09_001643 [Rumex salicifolius]
MKTSLKKLRGALQKHDRSGTKILPLAQLDELAKASAEMEDMRDCYDSLLSAAAAAANSAYESLREMGACLLQKVPMNDDEDSGKVLMMLGKVQFELQKLVDSYRGHIFQTITCPSESLLNELHTVEEMKHDCDEKRDLYDYMRTKVKEKGRLKGGKGENFSPQQLQAARDEFDEEATMFVFRMKSLKQGQSRSLLTQAARHHAAQLSFFKKSLKSLEAVEPHVKSVTEQQHIEYNFTGLEDDESEDADDYDDNDADNDSDGSSMDDDDDENGELSFDYRRSHYPHNLSTSRRSMEVDLDVKYPHFAKMDVAKENLDLGYDLIRDQKLLSQSAPLLPQRKMDPAAIFRQLRPSSSKKFHSYVLPTPGDTKSPYATGNENPTRYSAAHSQNLWGSKDDILSTPVLKESNNNNNKIPPLLTELNSTALSESKKIKRLSYSGPLTSKPWTSRRPFYGTEPLQFSSGPILRNPLPQSSSSPKPSPNASPTLRSASPRINELHELPRPPPPHLTYQPASPSSGLVGFSAPLMMSRNSDISAVNKSSSPRLASPLPVPPPVGSSMPVNSPRSRTLSPPSSRPHESYDSITVSPPLTPISLAKESIDKQPHNEIDRINWRLLL